MRDATQTTSSDRGLLVALAICCVGPMLLIVVLTSVVGVALNWAAALSLGLVAAGVCIAVMVQRHGRHGHGGHSQGVDGGATR